MNIIHLSTATSLQRRPARQLGLFPVVVMVVVGVLVVILVVVVVVVVE